jgi:hypothetical protein
VTEAGALNRVGERLVAPRGPRQHSVRWRVRVLPSPTRSVDRRRRHRRVPWADFIDAPTRRAPHGAHRYRVLPRKARSRQGRAFGLGEETRAGCAYPCPFPLAPAGHRVAYRLRGRDRQARARVVSWFAVWNSCSATHIKAVASFGNLRTDWEPSSRVISTPKAGGPSNTTL